MGRKVRRKARPAQVDARFDAKDVRDISDVTGTDDIYVPIVVTEEILVITDTDPYGIEIVVEDDL